MIELPIVLPIVLPMELPNAFPIGFPTLCFPTKSSRKHACVDGSSWSENHKVGKPLGQKHWTLGG